MFELGRWGRGAAATMLVALSMLTLSPPAFAGSANRKTEDPYTFGNPGFCSPGEPVNDFGLSNLPPVREAPASGDLPFGPKTVSLRVWAGPVVPVGEGVGFWLDSENYVGRTPLRWVVRQRIRRVDESGVPGEITARGRVRVRFIRAAREVKSFLRPPAQPGFYLQEIEIAEFGGRRLARYRHYVRVERKFWDARLGLSRQRLEPGDRLLIRIENFGTLPIAYGEEFRVQAYRHSSWVHVRNPSGNIWLLWEGFVTAGWAGRCNALRLPSDFPPGTYRVLKEVSGATSPEDERQPTWLTASFEVAEATS